MEWNQIRGRKSFVLISGVKNPLAFPTMALGAVVYEPTIDGLCRGLTSSKKLPLAIATVVATIRVGCTVAHAISIKFELGA